MYDPGGNMTYTSFLFLISFPVFIILYWMTNFKVRKLLLIGLNLAFLFSFSKKAVIFALAISLASYCVSQLIIRLPKYKNVIKRIFVSIVVLSFVYLKFTNYLLNIVNDFMNLNIGLISMFAPIGFSFYIIQCIMFVVDVSNDKVAHSDINILDFLTFNTYFLTIIQGPINKYQNFKNQLTNTREFNQSFLKEGLYLFSMGLLKKLIIVNRLNGLTSEIFGNYSDYSGKAILIATLFYTIELYMDFSAAVDIARGISFMFGIELPNNFNNPYKSLSIREFWSRWHITLTTFFREYLYFPLGGSRKGVARQYLNIYIIFIVSALWHGTGLNYLLWGIFHASLQIIEVSINKNPKVKTLPDNAVTKFIKWIYTFTMINIGWLMFNASGLKAFLRMFKSIFRNYNVPLNLNIASLKGIDLLICFVAIIFVFYREMKNDNKQDPMRKNNNQVFLFTYLVVIFVLIFGYYGVGFNASDFIYMGF